MILLAHGVTILDARASLTYLETSAPLLVALSAAACHTFSLRANSLAGTNAVWVVGCCVLLCVDADIHAGDHYSLRLVLHHTITSYY